MSLFSDPCLRPALPRAVAAAAPWSWGEFPEIVK